jgi:hypothetical protein
VVPLGHSDVEFDQSKLTFRKEHAACIFKVEEKDTHETRVKAHGTVCLFFTPNIEAKCSSKTSVDF